MKIFTALASFVAITALLFPLYEGTAAIAVALGGGAVVALFVFLALNTQEKMQQQQNETLNQLLMQSNTHLQESFQTYQDQLTGQVEQVAQATNEQLITLWQATQQDIKGDTKAMYDQSTDILAQLKEQQAQQKRVTEQIASELLQTSQTLQQSLADWLTKQQQQAEQTFRDVQITHRQLLDQTTEAHEKLAELWQKHQAEQLMIRQEEQKHLEKVVHTVEAKEAAYTEYLEQQKATFTQTYEELKQALQNSAQLSHDQLLVAWEKSSADQLALRVEEKEHIQQLQEDVKDILTVNATSLSDTIAAAWSKTNEQLVELRVEEKEHAAEVLATFDAANAKLIASVSEQNETFTTAQNFYENTYTSITTFTESVQKHEHRLVAHHQQLIDTQQSIKETIEATLQKTFKQHTDVLTTVELQIKNGLEELKEQRAVTSETFDDFIETFAETLEVQSEMTEKIQKELKNSVGELVEDVAEEIGKLVKDQRRSVDNFEMKIVNAVENIQLTMDQNKELYTIVVDQSKATKETAASLQTAFKDNSTLNKKEIDLLEKLMR